MTKANDRLPESPEENLPPEAEAWLQEHPDEDRASLERAWQLAAPVRDEAVPFTPDPERVRHMETRIAAATRHGDRAPVRGGPATRRWASRPWPVAAAVVALVVVAVGLFWLRPVTITAPAGDVLAVHLPDGSEVELNSGSRLTYRRLFGWRTRRVTLRGEAFFEVVHDPTPFVVQTFNSTVTVLGTRFNVRAWPEDYTPATTVVLEQGRVRLAAGTDAAQTVVLEPGQRSRVAADSAGPAPPVSASVQEALAWRRGGLHFTDAPLGEILDEVQRRTGARITVADPTLRDLRATLLLEHVDSAETVLAILAEMRDLHYRSTEDGYVLVPAGQP